MIPVRPTRLLPLLGLVALSGCGHPSSTVLAPREGAPVAAEAVRSLPRLEPLGETPCEPSYEGPTFTVTGPGLVYTYPSGGYSVTPDREVLVEVPANRTVTLGWSADGSFGCTEVRWYSWTLDIVDLDDNTPRIDEATDLAHWSMRSPTATSTTVGPFVEGDVHRLYVQAEDNTGRRSLAIFRIEVGPAVNGPPDVQSAVGEIGMSRYGDLVPVRITGVSDPDGDPVTITVIGVTQDEPLVQRGERPTCPDAVIQGGAASVRRERSPTGNGRVYTIEFVATDGQGGETSGTVEVCIPHDRSPHGGCTRDALVVSSLGPCDRALAGRLTP